MTAGIPQTRTLIVEAEGVQESQLPELEVLPADGIRQYPDQPELAREITQRGLQARRTERYAVIAQAEGRPMLPGLVLPWFDVTEGIWQAATLPPRELDPEARYFAGGQASVRGFDLNSVGPVVSDTDIPEGGGALFVLNQEIRIPIWDPIRIAVFADIGQVWESWREADFNFSIGAGIGVRWSTPIGPLWADVAWPVANIGVSSKKPKFYLGIGRPF